MTTIEASPTQPVNQFEVLYEYAHEAQGVLQHCIGEWAKLGDFKPMTPFPGAKGEPRSHEKMKSDYGGHTKHLKGLSRASLVFDDCIVLLDMLGFLQKDVKIKIVSLKNKFGSPTPLGHRDFCLIIELEKLPKCV